MIHTGQLGMGPGPSSSGEPPQDSNLGKWKEADGKGAAAAGPVKAACLSCRQKKAKCDGAKPACGQCSRKQIECIYIKSKRGGARKKRVPNPPSALVEYLKKLDQLLSVPNFGLTHAEPQEGDDPTNVVRTFASREETLRCYYNEVHPYLPVMPPRHYLVDVLPTLLPESPFLLASQAIMTLIPHPLDPNPQSPQSKRMRSAASAALGKQAMACVEKTLATTSSLEVVQALTILAVWEWGSTNDAETAIARCSSAVQVAMEMGIHDMDKNGTGYALEGIDWKKDMQRRTWWILYVYQLTGSLVSGITAPVGPDDERIQVDVPVCSDKDRTWSTWINCIRQCYRAINHVNRLAFADGLPEGGASPWGAPPADATPEEIERKRAAMVSLDKEIMQLMKDTERLSIIEHVPGGEEDVAKNQQIATRLGLAVAHIHIHRWTAFPEVSLFSKRICGFPKPKPAVSDDEFSHEGSTLLSHEGSTQRDFSSPIPPPSAKGSFTSPLAVPMTQTMSLPPPPSNPPPPLQPKFNTLDSATRRAIVPNAQLAQQPKFNTMDSATRRAIVTPQNLQTPQTLQNAYAGMSFTDANGNLNVAMQNQQLQPPPQNQVGQQQPFNQHNMLGSAFRDHEVYQVGQLMANLQSSQPPLQRFTPSPHSQQFNGSPQNFTGSPQNMGGSPQAFNSPQQFNDSPISAQFNHSPAAQFGTSPGSVAPFSLPPNAQYNNSPVNFAPPPAAFNAAPAPALPPQPRAILPPRTSSLNATQPINPNPTTATSAFDNMTSTFQPALNTLNFVPGDLAHMQVAAPAYNPALQEQWHYDLQQNTYPGIVDDMWQPETYPNYLPAPWFSQPGGAAALCADSGEGPVRHYPELRPMPPAAGPPSLSGSVGSASGKKHRAWGVDEKGDLAPNAVVEAAERAETFPPGISLARCATAAHTIVRLEVLHRSAVLAMDGTPRWIPFCSCGLVSGAYAFLLLILAVQAENTFGEYSQERMDEVENLLTNVRVILAGLEAYGIMWEGIDMMAREVRAAVDAATKLPMEIRSQRSNSPPTSLPPP